MQWGLHHVGLLVRDIPQATPFYVRVGYEVKSDVIHDPIQTAYVQFLRLPADQVYLELISPDGPQSKLHNAMQKGGGLNHLCYWTEDMPASCLWFRETGCFPISEPVPAVAFGGRRVAWFRGADRLLIELVERGGEGEL